MSRYAYLRKPNQHAKTIAMVDHAVAIAESYRSQGFTLTLRQLYYQFVSRDLIPNSQKSYDTLGRVVTDARNFGDLDWDAIEDRGRNLNRVGTWEDPAAFLNRIGTAYRTDYWKDAPHRIEVWVEKDALSSIVEQACEPFQIASMACKGYMSASEMRSSGLRVARYLRTGQAVTILHLGDHDPSGLDMTRDIRDRLSLYAGAHADLSGFNVDRIALNRDQIEQYGPPPNPTKLSDSRATDYVAEHGYESWELDALEPQVLIDLITRHVEGIYDEDIFREAMDLCEIDQDRLNRLGTHWHNGISDLVDELGDYS